MAVRLLALRTRHTLLPRNIIIFVFLVLSDQKQHDYHQPSTLIFSASPIEDKTERLPFWHK
jgi:hypothetical protein